MLSGPVCSAVSAIGSVSHWSVAPRDTAATLPGFVYPGDTASASRTYARDITEQALEATDGIMPVPSGAGIGVTLDRAFLETVTESLQFVRR